MKLFEHMGKELFAEYGIPVPRGRVASTPDQCAEIAAEIGVPVVVKSQILSGKRGKAGGIGFADNPEEAKQEGIRLLGSSLRGFSVDWVLVEEKLCIDKEFYLAMTIDGNTRSPVLLASAQGGMDIEEVPEEQIIKFPIDISIGLQPFHLRQLTYGFNFSKNQAKDFSKLVQNLYRLFREKDAELVEINPLVLSGENVIAADAKVTIDDDASFRRKEFPEISERTEVEERAHALGLAYVELEGDIAVMANGAGITMATLDMLQHYGGRPANFLDAGGGAGVEPTAQAVELLLSTNPKAILVNIFGGITRCDDVATAFAQVKREKGITVPVVVRLVGTNQEKGHEILQQAGIAAYTTMKEAAQTVVKQANQQQGEV